jgi:hypothetical protein
VRLSGWHVRAAARRHHPCEGHRNAEPAGALPHSRGEPRLEQPNYLCAGQQDGGWQKDDSYERSRLRCATHPSGWKKRTMAISIPAIEVRPFDYLTDVGRQFREARAKAGLHGNLVWYCCRHDYGTRVLTKTGNLAAVMKTMGHKDVRAAMQHRHLELVRAALDQGRESALPMAAQEKPGRVLGHRRKTSTR